MRFAEVDRVGYTWSVGVKDIGYLVPIRLPTK